MTAPPSRRAKRGRGEEEQQQAAEEPAEKDGEEQEEGGAGAGGKRASGRSTRSAPKAAPKSPAKATKAVSKTAGKGGGKGSQVPAAAAGKGKDKAATKKGAVSSRSRRSKNDDPEEEEEGGGGKDDNDEDDEGKQEASSSQASSSQSSTSTRRGGAKKPGESGASSDGAADAKKSAVKKPKLLFTNCAVTAAGKKEMAKIGATETANVAQATHVVASSTKDKMPFKRSAKVMAAISFCPRIVDMAWLVESAAAGVALDEDAYIVRSPEAEERYGFKMDAALADKSKVLAGLSVHCTEVPKGVKAPPPDDMKLIVESAGKSHPSGGREGRQAGRQCFVLFFQKVVVYLGSSSPLPCPLPSRPPRWKVGGESRPPIEGGAVVAARGVVRRGRRRQRERGGELARGGGAGTRGRHRHARVRLRRGDAQVARHRPAPRRGVFVEVI